ncbi:MAG: YbhB/YbcL family Raf kinase inhibitor-like protein [Parachlamydiaceae bacterium]
MWIESVFEANQPIPSEYTFDGENQSPFIRFLELPPDAKSLVLVLDDPDATKGTFDHWIVWNIPPNIKELKRGAPELSQILPPPVQGLNSYGKNGYSGPNPPPGKVHHYRFKLYALDSMLNLPESSTKREVEAGMEGHIIARAQLIGTYQR